MEIKVTCFSMSENDLEVLTFVYAIIIDNQEYEFATAEVSELGDLILDFNTSLFTEIEKPEIINQLVYLLLENGLKYIIGSKMSDEKLASILLSTKNEIENNQEIYLRAKEYYKQLVFEETNNSGVPKK